MIIQIKYFHDAKDEMDAEAQKPNLWVNCKDLDDAQDVLLSRIPKLREQLRLEAENEAANDF